jgi:hypothetical protein
VLLGPVERQIEFAQTRRCELYGVAAFRDRFGEPGAQESEIDEASDVTPSDTVALGQLHGPKRSRSPAEAGPTYSSFRRIGV